MWGKFGMYSKAQPEKISDPISDLKVIKVACTHTDILFLTNIGDVYDWKYNSERPRLLSSISDKLIKDIACGLNHMLFLTFDGKVLVAGSGEFGQLVKSKLLLKKNQFDFDFVDERDVEKIR